MNKQTRKKILHNFEKAYVKHYTNLLKFAVELIGNYEDARDVCQELFVDFHSNIESVENPEKWLYGAIRYKIYNFFRSNKHKLINIDDITEIDLPIENRDFIESKILLQEVIDNDENYKDETDKIIFDLVAFKGYSYEKAGRHLGFSKSKVRYKYSQLISRLNESFKKRGITKIEAVLCIIMIISIILKTL